MVVLRALWDGFVVVAATRQAQQLALAGNAQMNVLGLNERAKVWG